MSKRAAVYGLGAAASIAAGIFAFWGYKRLFGTASGFYAEYGMTALLEVMWIGIPAFCIVAVKRERLGNFLESLRLPDRFRVSLVILCGVALTVVAALASAMWIALLQRFHYTELSASMRNPSGIAQWLFALLCAAVLPAICEETLFRGLLLPGLMRRMPLAAAFLLSSAVFAAAHLSLEGFPAVFLTGLTLCVVMASSDRLLLCILLHAAYNASVLAINRFSDGIGIVPIALCIVCYVLSLRALVRKEPIQ